MILVILLFMELDQFLSSIRDLHTLYARETETVPLWAVGWIVYWISLLLRLPVVMLTTPTIYTALSQTIGFEKCCTESLFLLGWDNDVNSLLMLSSVKGREVSMFFFFLSIILIRPCCSHVHSTSSQQFHVLLLSLFNSSNSQATKNRVRQKKLFQHEQLC